MDKQNFQLNVLRSFTLLIVCFDDKTYAFGVDYVARILEFKIFDTTYISRSYYAETIPDQEEQLYRGDKIEVPERESDLVGPLINSFPTLLGKFIQTEMIGVVCDIPEMNTALCRKCTGKGFTDWIEDIKIPDWKSQTIHQDRLTTYSIMGKLFTQFTLHDNVSVFYRNRNLTNKYIQQCQICDECRGVGFDAPFLIKYIPYSIIDNLSKMVKNHIQTLSQDYLQEQTLNTIST